MFATQASTGAARLFSLPRVGHGYGVPAHWQKEFLAAYHAVADAPSPHDVPRVSTPGVSDLSLIEVAATGTRTGDTMAIILTGDGGWADLDKGLAEGLSAAGIPVVGWSSLDYYWSPRTPEQASADLARIVSHYSAAWKRQRVIVVGYSFGADVAPFLVNRLSNPVKAQITRVALLGPSEDAAFEFHLASWVGGGGNRRYPTRPEIDRLSVPTVCISAIDETESVCRTTANRLVRAEAVGSGHHFSSEYGRLVELIVR